MSLRFQVTFDCHDPEALASFWAEALGYVEAPPPAGFTDWDAFLASAGVPEEDRDSASLLVDPDGDGPSLFFQRVPETHTGKNPLHLDIRTATELAGEERMAALERRAAELVGLGATRVARVEPATNGMHRGFIVMRDPEQNEFCLD